MATVILPTAFAILASSAYRQGPSKTVTEHAALALYTIRTKDTNGALDAFPAGADMQKNFIVKNEFWKIWKSLALGELEPEFLGLQECLQPMSLIIKIESSTL